jgi:glutamate formiminotransferase/formiminotetrahydrofolate cyclodeaminase
MSVLVECVPNFSEGSNVSILNAIRASIETVTGVQVLDVDPGVAANRTVFTFVGSPDDVQEAAFRAIQTAGDLIDMRHHSGEHPRMGATDVCPFVPVKDCTLEDCVQLAKGLAERVWNELQIPTYLYESAASSPHRTRLPDLRKGEYEALSSKIGDAQWGPDFGPSEWTDRAAQTGATVIGARPFLIAWNINLNTNNQRKAEKIAATIRNKGGYVRDENGELKRGEDGKPFRSPGMFRHVNAIGWTIDEYGHCQISCNVLDFTKTGLHEIYDAVRVLALEEGIVVTGSELVGLTPLQALLDAGRHYLEQAGENPGIPYHQLLRVAIRSLGLNDLAPFDVSKSVIEYQIASDGPLVRQSVRDFTDLLSSDAPAPGGGSVAALCGALATGLAAMVGQLSTKITKNNWPYAQPRPEGWTEFDAAGMLAQSLKEAFLHDVDADTAAFDAMMSAMRLPKQTPEQRQARIQAIRAARTQAIETPLGVLNRCVQTLNVVDVALTGNPNARSDAGVASSLVLTCAQGAWMNVLINLQDLKDLERKARYLEQAERLLEEVSKRVAIQQQQVHRYLREQLGGE